MSLRSMTRQQRSAGVIASVAMVALIAAGCGDGDDEPAATDDGDTVEDADVDDDADDEEPAAAGDERCEGQDGEGRTVGFGNLGEAVPFAVLVREGIEEVGSECNLNIVNADNELDPQAALDNARNFVAQGVDGVIQFNVHGDISEAVCEILEGLPVIAIDIAHPECAVFMGADNRGAGEIGGQGMGAVVEELWDCEVDRIVSFEAFGVGQVNIDRLNGQIGGLVSVCPDLDVGDFEDWAPTHPDTIITRLDADRTDPAFDQGRDWLTANPDAERIVAVCINDDACIGFHAAVEAAGRSGQVIFASQGADPTSWDLIRDDQYFAGSVAYFPERYGELLVPNIIRMMNGEAPASDPLLMDHVLITAENLDEFYG